MSLLANRPITVPQGKGYTHLLTFVNADGSPRDMSDCEFSGEIRLAPGKELLGSFDFNDANAIDGLVIMSLAPTVTVDQRRLAWSYDVQWQIAGFDPIPFMGGPFRIEQAVTQ